MKRLPFLAIPLGLGGLIPFVVGAAAILFFPADIPAPRMLAAFIDYGAVILAFLGAVHWGLALAGDPHGVTIRPELNRARLVLGVLPALVGWTALMIPLVAAPVLALVVLLLGFVLTASVEARAARLGLMPPGYMTLRWLLTVVVVVCQAAVLLARLV